jgi:hypothetical protein
LSSCHANRPGGTVIVIAENFSNKPFLLPKSTVVGVTEQILEQQKAALAESNNDCSNVTERCKNKRLVDPNSEKLHKSHEA